ncbi:MAG: LysM peptidoglycan-binding domain-containing protein [Oceanospirillaceae bacterium]|nr:LysM peptidoglycan-binding domain-containing protein [Oceanospirillaceae bacterium]
MNTPEDTAKSAQKSEQPSNQISYNSKVDNTPSAEVLFSTTTPSVIVTDPPPESAESIAEKIANNNSLAWSELDTESSTSTAADLLAEAYEQPEPVTEVKITTQAIPEPVLALEPVPELDLWQLTVANYGLGHVQNPRIDQHYHWYNKHQEYMHRVTTRASRYYHFMLHSALAKSLPAEIALLPIIESGFDPFAYSSGRASGAWQFIPSTGRVFGLKQNWWYDGRRDIMASTQAAHKYLIQLHKMFDGDWLLAIASYNGGQGTVLKAIKRNKKAGKPTDFWSLNLPKETMNYVPKLLAVARVVAEHAGTDTLNSVANEAYFEAIDVGSQIDLAQAAEMANITTDEMYRLNPAFNQWATDPQGPHHLLIPVAHLGTFNASLLDLPSNKRVSWERYKIVTGDNLLRLAKRYHVSVDLLRTINNIDGNMIWAGKTLMIPVASKDAAAYTLSAAQRVINRQKQISQTQASQRVEYSVKSGDSLWKIGQKYKVTVTQIAGWNKLGSRSVLQIGDKLNLWPRSSTNKLATAQRTVVKKLTYKVRSGDNLSVIAQRFSVTVKDIQKWNQVLKKYLQPGQKLTLYVNVTKLKQ